MAHGTLLDNDFWGAYVHFTSVAISEGNNKNAYYCYDFWGS